MSIHVTCPNGHDLKVKDKYAGKEGRCPHCHEKVHVPAQHHGLSDDDAMALIGDYSPPPPPKPMLPLPETTDIEHEAASVLDDHPADVYSTGSGLSLLGSSVIRHKKVCAKCGNTCNHWFASCDKCGTYFED